MMNKTPIYTTRKLEKTIKGFVSENQQITNSYLGEWTANIFYVSRKKCWILINKTTKYLLLFPDIKKSDLKNISSIFKETFYAQLIYDGIVVEYKLIEKIIGEMILCETNNDRSANGSLNNCLQQMDYWKCEYENFENTPFRDLNHRLNSSPNKMLHWQFPKEKMKEMISSFE